MAVWLAKWDDLEKYSGDGECWHGRCMNERAVGDLVKVAVAGARHCGRKMNGADRVRQESKGLMRALGECLNVENVPKPPDYIRLT